MKKEVAFKSSPKIFQNYKSDRPERTIAKAENFLKKTGLDLNKFTFHWNKIENENFSIYQGYLLYHNTTYVAGGKGLSYQLTKASAYSEVVERILVGLSPLNAYIKPKINFIIKPGLSNYFLSDQSKIKNPVNVEDFFRHFPSLNIQSVKENKTGRHWINGYSLINGKSKKIPHLLVNSVSGSNGCAAGNTMEEATVQAFCEVCERYSLIEHLSKKLSAPSIDPKSIKSKRIDQAINLFKSLNIDVEIKDLTLGNKIPVIGILFTNQNLAHEKNTFRKKLFFKTLSVGSDVNLENALMRCFMEKNQTCKNRDELIFNLETHLLDQYFSEKEKTEIIKRKGKQKRFFPMMTLNRSFENFKFLNKKGAIISFDELTTYQNNDFLQDIEAIKKICLKNEWEAFLIDCSIPASSLNTVRVIIPSISDTLRFRYSRISEITDIFDDEFSSVSLLQAKKENIEELINIIEDYLVEDVIPLLPITIKEKYRTDKVFLILLGLHLLMKNKKKSEKIAQITEEYLPKLNKIAKD